MTILLAPEDFVGIHHLRELIVFHQRKLLEATLSAKEREYHRDCLSWCEQELAHEQKEQER